MREYTIIVATVVNLLSVGIFMYFLSTGNRTPITTYVCCTLSYISTFAHIFRNTFCNETVQTHMISMLCISTYACPSVYWHQHTRSTVSEQQLYSNGSKMILWDICAILPPFSTIVNVTNANADFICDWQLLIYCLGHCNVHCKRILTFTNKS